MFNFFRLYKTMDTFILILLLTIPAITTAECEPGFADSCFTAVQTDLEFMVNFDGGVPKNLSQAVLVDLCISLDDSLNCTSDIIDTDCSFKEGRDNFDNWVKAFRSTYRYLCYSDDGETRFKYLKDLLQGIECWNVDHFFTCTKEYANLNHIKDLLHEELTDQECRYLQTIFRTCYEAAVVGSCREQDVIGRDFDGLVVAFFEASPCFKPKEAFHSSSASHLNIQLISFVAILFCSFWSIFQWFKNYS